MTPARIERAEKFGAALHELVNGIEISQSERNRTAGASFGIALDHHGAIVLLTKNSLYSSGFALLRCLFEAYLRGLWLKHCATGAQVTAFYKGVEPPKTMLAEIESTAEFSNRVLSRIKEDRWRTMCDFTHTGGLHLQRWQSEEAIEPTFREAELDECLNFAELIGAMSALELAQLATNSDDGASVLALMGERWPATRA